MFQIILKTHEKTIWVDFPHYFVIYSMVWYDPCGESITFGFD